MDGAGRSGGMRLLHFADLHLDAPFTWAGPRLARARRAALRQCLLRVVELAETAKVDALCCAGDLYEQERFTPDTALFLRELFARLRPTPVLLAPGNHDWLGPASLYRQVTWTDNVHVFAEAALTAFTLADGCTIWGAAHLAPANTPGFFDDGFVVDRGGVHIGLFHGSAQDALTFERGGKVPHAPFRAGQIRAAGLHHALVGHFHTPRDAAEFTYPGNPEPLTFGEHGERGAVLVGIDGTGAVRRERHRLATTELHEIEVDLDGAPHAQDVRARVAAALAGRTGVARVTLRGQVAPELDLDLDDVASLDDERLRLVPRLGDLTVGYDLDALAGDRTVRGQFVADVLAATHLTSSQRHRVLVTGLRALSGRDDLGVH